MPAEQSLSEVLNLDAFLLMCVKLKISSKRYGRCALRPIATQRYLITEILEALKAGIHQFVILKCRQSGTTTISLAFLLYWMQRHSGMTGLFAIDSDENRTKQNLAFRMMYDALAEAGDDWCVPRTIDARELVGWANGSSLGFDNANKRKKGTLGRSTGLNIGFFDEVAFWDDPNSLVSLKPSIDNFNPNRLYIYASTANGFNLFHKMCQRAEQSRAIRFIFIGWWRHEWYRIERDDALGVFEAYWDGTLSGDEEMWVNEIKTKYDFDIVPEQIVWWRYMLTEEFHDDLSALKQEYPCLPPDAFQYGGSTFFDPESLRLSTIEISSPSSSYCPRYFRFKFGKNFLETTVEETDSRSGKYHLEVFEPPRDGEGVFYSIGVDPAYGMSETSDYGCIQLVRCFEDGMEQCAEFAARGLNTKHLAWAMLYLFGAYHRQDGTPNVVWNVEIQGGGASVIDEVEHLQADVTGFYDKLGLAFDSLRAYAYKRIDSLSPNYTAKHFNQSALTRDQGLHHIKSYFECGRLMLHSMNLVNEMSYMIRGPGGYIESSDGKHDDLVMGLLVAVFNYLDPIRYDLEGSGCTIGKWMDERSLLLKGATSDDLLYLRVKDWITEKRDLAREREEELKNLISG